MGTCTSWILLYHHSSRELLSKSDLRWVTGAYWTVPRDCGRRKEKQNEQSDYHTILQIGRKEATLFSHNEACTISEARRGTARSSRRGHNFADSLGNQDGRGFLRLQKDYSLPYYCNRNVALYAGSNPPNWGILGVTFIVFFSITLYSWTYHLRLWERLWRVNSEKPSSIWSFYQMEVISSQKFTRSAQEPFVHLLKKKNGSKPFLTTTLDLSATSATLTDLTTPIWKTTQFDRRIHHSWTCYSI